VTEGQHIKKFADDTKLGQVIYNLD
jgi:hypothetical protein